MERSNDNRQVWHLSTKGATLTQGVTQTHPWCCTRLSFDVSRGQASLLLSTPFGSADAFGTPTGVQNLRET